MLYCILLFPSRPSPRLLVVALHPRRSRFARRASQTALQCLRCALVEVWIGMFKLRVCPKKARGELVEPRCMRIHIARYRSELTHTRECLSRWRMEG